MKHPEGIKKPPENIPPPMGPVGGYGGYMPFYAQSPYLVPQDHSTSKSSLVQSPLAQQQTQPGDYSNKNKEPPLDLMNKPPPQQQQQQQPHPPHPHHHQLQHHQQQQHQQSVDGPTKDGNVPTTPQNKVMGGHYYPYSKYTDLFSYFGNF